MSTASFSDMLLSSTLKLVASRLNWAIFLVRFQDGGFDCEQKVGGHGQGVHSEGIICTGQSSWL